MYTYKAVLFRINKQSKINLHIALSVGDSVLATPQWPAVQNSAFIGILRVTDLTKLDSNWQLIGENLWSEIGNNQSRQNTRHKLKLIRKWILFNKIRKISNFTTTSRNKNRTPRTKRIMMESSLATNGNTMEFSEDNSQGLTQPRLREEAGQLQRSLRNLKGLLTREVNACNDKISHFKLRFVDNFMTRWCYITEKTPGAHTYSILRGKLSQSGFNSIPIKNKW